MIQPSKNCVDTMTSQILEYLQELLYENLVSTFSRVYKMIGSFFIGASIF